MSSPCPISVRFIRSTPRWGVSPPRCSWGCRPRGTPPTSPCASFWTPCPKPPPTPAKGFVGSPYRADPTKKTRTTIYPTKLAEYGRQYGNVIDLTGATTQQIQLEVLSGNPVVAYVTLYWQTPYYRYYNIEGQTQRLLSNNHAVLVCGYNAANHTYYIADPYNVSRPSSPISTGSAAICLTSCTTSAITRWPSPDRTEPWQAAPRQPAFLH